MPSHKFCNALVDAIRTSGWKVVLFLILLLINYFHPSVPGAVGFKFLTGQNPRSDIGQDFYGFRALINNWDTYPPLKVAFGRIGVDWDLPLASTHPPTAYLFTAPVAFFPWPVASALWGWLMLTAIVVSLRLYDVPWWVCPFILVWPPVMFSLRQLTPIWMLGLALAYHNRDKPFFSGMSIALASLTKFFPVLVLIPFIFRRKWSAVLGFILVWAIALLLIMIICPAAIPRYIEVNLLDAPVVVARIDNTAFLPTLQRLAGWPGFVIGAIFLAIIVWKGRKNWHTWEFLSVALLPICWIYSLLPLLPGLLKRFSLPAIIAMAIPIFVKSMGEGAPITFIPLFVLTGISMIIDNPPGAWWNYKTIGQKFGRLNFLSRK